MAAVLHRASIAELVIPYGDPAPTTHYKNAFDVGEYGMGAMANALELGCDCLGEIRYLDADLVSWHGEPSPLRERDLPARGGRRHPLEARRRRTGGVEVRRARRFVVSCICTVGNYEYGYYWYLHQDGSIAFEVKLTGVLHTTAVAPGTVGAALDGGRARRGRAVPPALPLRAPRHGRRRRRQPRRRGGVGERDPRGPDNPHGTSFRTRRTVLASESRAPAT